MTARPSTAYCGLSCSVCVHSSKGCAGCRNGGGPDSCLKRDCAMEFGLEGCWQCGDFPCEKGFLSDEVWAGLTAGCVQVIRERGVEAFEALARARLGESYDYGYLRFKTPQEVVALLTGEGGGASAPGTGDAGS